MRSRKKPSCLQSLNCSRPSRSATSQSKRLKEKLGCRQSYDLTNGGRVRPTSPPMPFSKRTHRDGLALAIRRRCLQGTCFDRCLAFFDTPAGLVLRHFLAEGLVDGEFASLFRDRFISLRREAIGEIFDRAVERGEIRRGLNREVVLDLIYGPGFYRILIRHEPLERTTVNEMVSALFKGLKGKSSQANRSLRRL